jgi:hypothetical protein
MPIRVWKSLRALFGWSVPAITLWTSIWSPRAEGGHLVEGLRADRAPPEPDPVIFPNTLNAHAENIYAAHRSHSSHSSHRSHSSHASHYSSSGSGGYSPPPSSPPLTLPSSPPSVVPSDPKSSPALPGQSVAPSAVEVARIKLTAGTERLIADGLSSTIITAALINSRGQPAPDGLMVTFTTDKGRFTTEDQKYLFGKAYSVATTKQGTGTVQVPFISEKDVLGVATIVAKVKGVGQTLQITLIAPSSQLRTPDPSLAKPQPNREDLTNLVLRVQIALSVAGYQSGAPDGILGPQTRTALQAFQRDRGIAVTGRLETATLDALGIILP